MIPGINYNAIVIGASGSVGKVLVNILLLSSACQHITTLGRRSVEDFEKNDKITQHVIDMENLEEAALKFAEGHNVAFSVLGVGSSMGVTLEQIKKVEVEYVSAFARGCKGAGVKRMQLFSVVGADANSSFNIAIVQGKKEELLKEVGFQHLSIFRPSVILGNANTPGILNYIVPALNVVLPYRFRGIHEKDLARSMVADVELNPTSEEKSVNIFEFQEMEKLSSNYKAEL